MKTGHSVATPSSKSNWVLEDSKDLKRQVGGRREAVPEDAFLTFALYHIPSLSGFILPLGQAGELLFFFPFYF